MGSIRGKLNVIVALALTALGCGGFVYFHYFAAAWKGWTILSAVMGGGAILALGRIPQPEPGELRRARPLRIESGATVFEAQAH